MKKFYVVLITIIMLLLCSCNLPDFLTLNNKNQLEDRISTSLRIVFTNNKEKALKFTVADPKVIKQIVDIISRGKIVNAAPDVNPDYSIKFYLANGGQIEFSYWMGASQNGKDVNFVDDQDTHYGISESLDTYIINSTKMYQRPGNFVDLYNTCLSKSISLLEKNQNGETEVGVDIKSDRRMRRYTMSYEEEGLLNGIKAEGYTILPLTDKYEFSYIVTFLTNIYNPSKSQVTVEAVKVSDQTKKTFNLECTLLNGKWIIDKVTTE